MSIGHPTSAITIFVRDNLHPICSDVLVPPAPFPYASPVTPLLTIPLLAFLISLGVHALALRYFPRFGLLDSPERYGFSRAPIPYPTGIVAIGIFMIFYWFLSPFSTETIGLLSAMVILGSACWIDDRTPLSPYTRIIIQTFVAVLLIASGIRIGAVTNPLTAAGSITLDGGWLFTFSVAFTVVWLLFTINALNWFDGIPGQVSTLSVIAFLTIGFLALSARVNQPSLALLSFILAAISLGMLPFDLHPPKLLMGDTGAMFFGLMIGVLTIHSGGKIATAFLVLGVPLIDVLFVIIRRLNRGESPFRGNSHDQHLHHRLLKKGWSPRQVIALTAGIGAAFGVTALFLSTGGKLVAGVVLLCVMLGLSEYSKPNG